jgi:hypothetical protein
LSLVVDVASPLGRRRRFDANIHNETQPPGIDPGFFLRGGLCWLGRMYIAMDSEAARLEQSFFFQNTKVTAERASRVHANADR